MSDERSSTEETYFTNYANKASKMSGWQLTNEIAIRLEDFDLLKNAKDDDPAEIDRAMRQIEILTKENLKRK